MYNIDHTLTHWPLWWFLSQFQLSMAEVSYVKLPSDDSNWALLMISQHWFRWHLGAIRQQAITRVKVDPDLCCYMFVANRPQWVKLTKDIPQFNVMDKLWDAYFEYFEENQPCYNNNQLHQKSRQGPFPCCKRSLKPRDRKIGNYFKSMLGVILECSIWILGAIVIKIRVKILQR